VASSAFILTDLHLFTHIHTLSLSNSLILSCRQFHQHFTRAHFSYESKLSSFSLVTNPKPKFVIFGAKISYEKPGHKMLMKLTPGLSLKLLVLYGNVTQMFLKKLEIRCNIRLFLLRHSRVLNWWQKWDYKIKTT